MNQELCKINDWLKFSHLSSNTAKTKILFFTKTKNNTSLSIMINASKIDGSDCVKYLGVYLDDKLNWCRHIQNIETKLAAGAIALFKLSEYLPLSASVPEYYSFVSSHLQYAIINWVNSMKFCIHKLQVRQNRIVKILCERFGRKSRLPPLSQNFNFYKLLKYIN